MISAKQAKFILKFKNAAKRLNKAAPGIKGGKEFIEMRRGGGGVYSEAGRLRLGAEKIASGAAKIGKAGAARVGRMAKQGTLQQLALTGGGIAGGNIAARKSEAGKDRWRAKKGLAPLTQTQKTAHRFAMGALGGALGWDIGAANRMFKYAKSEGRYDRFRRAQAAYGRSRRGGPTPRY